MSRYTDRRQILVLLAAAAAFPLSARAQQARIPTIGILVQGVPTPVPFLKAIREGLTELGYSEGRNIKLEVRSAEGKADILAEKAADLVRLNVDIIVAFQTPAATAAKRETGVIPIVMAPVGDALGTGLVSSLSRPGGNITGISAAAAEVAGKTVELIRELMPSAQRIAVLANEIDPFTRPFVAQIDRDARTLGMEAESFMVQPMQPVEAVFESIAAWKPNALIIQGSLTSKEVIDLAIKHRLPAFSSNQVVPAMGGLMSYAANQHDMYKRATVYIDRILKGAKAGDLPVEQPTKYQLVINLRTAKALGIEVSPALLARADEVIE